MITFFSYFLYCVVGVVMSSAGVGITHWQFWVVLVAMAFNEALIKVQYSRL